MELSLVSILASILVSPAAVATPIELSESGTAGFVGQAEQGPLDLPVVVESYLEFATIFGTTTDGLDNPYLAPSVAAFFANGGQRLYVVRVVTADDADLIGNDGGSPGARTGLQALIDIDEVAVIAIPGAVTPAVQAAMIAHCETLTGRLAILDPATTDNLDTIVAQRAGLVSTNGHAALYFPWVQAAPAGESLLLPPSGFVAGVYARTAAHDAPIGEVVTATGVSFNVTSDQQAMLNPLGIDVLRFFAGSGVQVWGARTIASDPEWQYISVRRAADAIEKSIQAGTAWCVQEPNDETLWAQLRLDVTDFLQALFLAGWFQGATPDDAFFVRCDQTTMTAQDIAEGRTIILVGFAPLAPGEFVILRVVQQRPPITAVSPRGHVAPRLHAPSPNPANPSTTLTFDQPRDGRAGLRLYDAGGRLVRVLVANDALAAGSHAYRWDGRDDAGREVPAGVYFVKVTTPSGETSGRVVLTR